MADSTPIPKRTLQRNRGRVPLSNVEVDNYKDMYKMFISGGYAGQHQYADLALLLKKNPINSAESTPTTATVPANSLLLEDGTSLLLEDGTELLLEA